MKRIIIYGLLLGAVLSLPLEGENVGKLLPVEVVRVHKEEGTIVITTDVGAQGSGNSVEAAIDNLKITTPGVIFLDTADYLLIDETAREDIHALDGHLKASLRVVNSVGEIDLKDAAAYLCVHKPASRLRDHKGQWNNEILTMENGRLILKEN